MKSEKRYKKITVIGKYVFIGIDVHKESWQVTARSEGEEVFHGRMPSEYHALRKLMDEFKECKIKVAYEAGPCGFWLHDKLVEDGIEIIVVPPSLIPVESGNRVKTDKRDSRKLAKLLESNMLKQVYVLTEEDREERELLRTRRQIVNHRSDVARQVKSKLLFYGISIPFTAKHTWSQEYIQWLRGLSFGKGILRVCLDRLIDLYEYLTGEIKKINKEIKALSESPKYKERLKLLRTVPGIGRLIGMEILVELQNIERFKTADELAAYIGLTPSEFSSGQHVRLGRITRCGNKRVRTCLVESGWILITKDPVMRQKYDKIKNVKGAKRAIIAIARNLIIRIRAILLGNQPYVVGVC